MKSFNFERTEVTNVCELNEKIPRHYKIMTSLVAGAAAGTVSKTVIAPLDRSKINFQISETRQYSLRRLLTFLSASVRQDGVCSLWRGNAATLTRVVPFSAINFSAHEQFKLMLQTTTVVNQNYSGLSGRHLPPFRRFLAGVLSGLTATTLTYPFDLVKARLSVTDKHTYTGMCDVFRKMYQTEGLRAVYRGYIPTILGAMPYTGTMFFMYESLKKLYSDRTGMSDPPTVWKLCFGGVSGGVGQLASYPFDIVRRRMQTAGVTEMNDVYTSTWKTILYVLRTEGFKRGLYKGITLNWIKGPISAGITFTVFEYIQVNMRRIKLLQTCPPQDDSSSSSSSGSR